MPRKITPRWGWEWDHENADMHTRLNELDWDWLLSKFGAETDEIATNLERSLLTALWQFYGEQFDARSPSFREVSAALSEVQKSAQRLQAQIQNLDAKSRSWLSGAFQELRDNHPDRYSEDCLKMSAHQFIGDEEIDGSPEILQNIDVMRDAILFLDLPEEPIAKGRKPMKPVHDFIFNVSQLLQKTSTTDPLKGFYADPISGEFKGPLIEVLEHLFEKFAPEMKLSNKAIGNHIRRTLGDRAKTIVAK